MTGCAFSFYECSLFSFLLLSSFLCLLWLVLLTCTAAEANTDEKEEKGGREVSEAELFLKRNQSQHVKSFPLTTPFFTSCASLHIKGFKLFHFISCGWVILEAAELYLCGWNTSLHV